MRHLQQNDVAQFLSLASESGLEYALSQLIFPNDYLANFTGSVPKEFVMVKLEGEKYLTEREGIYLTDKTSWDQYQTDSSMKGFEPMFSEHTIHFGGIFGRTECIRAVGGYTGSYMIWGHEDKDLQWKLHETYGCQHIPDTPENEVLHLDHPRGYFTNEQNLLNAAIFQKRKEEGVKAAIENDRVKYLRKDQ
jgi:hypothetical protein